MQAGRFFLKRPASDYELENDHENHKEVIGCGMFFLLTSVDHISRIDIYNFLVTMYFIATHIKSGPQGRKGVPHDDKDSKAHCCPDRYPHFQYCYWHGSFRICGALSRL